jgi:NAD(P)-dependent dehydrogenase (short-subunit alcohol dehydrogenase family)
MTEEKADAVAAAVPMGRRGTPFEIADAIAFLCSSYATYINGHTLVVDGGMAGGVGGGGKEASEKLSTVPEYPFTLHHQYDGDARS